MIFIVETKPKGKGRPRVTKNGTYTPESTRQFEHRIAAAYKYQTRVLHKGALIVNVTALFKPPKSTSKKKAKELIGTPYLHRPDGDNILKAVLDALNGIAYNDDCQVFKSTVSKKYGEIDAVVIEIMEA